MKTSIWLGMLLTLVCGISVAQITSTASGNWSNAATWVGGVVPASSNDVFVASGTTVTIDIPTASCHNLTVDGRLTFPDVSDLGITINGNCSVSATGKFTTFASGTTTGTKYQTITIYKNLSVASGGNFDMRKGSGTNVAVGKVIFTGSENTSINLSQTIYESSIEEFNSVVINKSAGAKIFLASGNLFQNNNSVNAPDTLVLLSGIIETGNNTWVHLATTSTSIQGASEASYFNGKLGRGISNSGSNTNRDFPVGDVRHFRPINIRFNSPANGTGHYVWVQLTNGNANTGNSKFAGDIDKVSALRYYEIGYMQNNGIANSMPMYSFTPTYSNDDGVTAGNKDLRVAYSTDTKATWNDAGPTKAATDLSAIPTPIRSDTIIPNLVVETGTSVFVALAQATGTTTNSLDVK